MDTEQLHDEWHDGEQTGLRPARIQRHHSFIEEVTGMDIPRRRHEIEEWLDTPGKRGTATQKINAAVDGGDTDEDGDGDGDEDADTDADADADTDESAE